MIINLSVFSLSSISFCFMCFEDLFLDVYISSMLWLFGKLTLLLWLFVSKNIPCSKVHCDIKIATPAPFWLFGINHPLIHVFILATVFLWREWLSLMFLFNKTSFFYLVRLELGLAIYNPWAKSRLQMGCTHLLIYYLCLLLNLIGKID